MDDRRGTTDEKGKGEMTSIEIELSKKLLHAQAAIIKLSERVGYIEKLFDQFVAEGLEETGERDAA